MKKTVWGNTMRKIININQKWAFSKEACKVPESMPKNWYWVNLPHTWNAIDGQDGGNDYYRGTCYYAKEIMKSELPENDRYFLEILGANASADVYVNGKKLAHHDGGYSTWRTDLTDTLTEENNLLVLAVDNSVNDHVYPQNADFTFYGGLYRDVNVIAVNSSHFDLSYYGGNGLKVTPEMNGVDAIVTVESFLSEVREGQELVCQILDADGKIVAEAKKQAGEKETFRLVIPQVHRWNGRKDPYLYTAQMALLLDGEEIDRVNARFGCRTYQIDPKKGFFLNGKSYPLRGVARHQDRKEAGNALLPEHHREDMDLICEMGANTIRLAHYQHAQYFYDLCDERGMIVWAEIPYISEHMQGGRENTISQMRELIVQNYHHPSIVVWGLSNEITTAENVNEDLMENHRILNDMVHKMDATRQSAIAVVSMCDIHHPYLQIPDVVSYNLYYGWYGGDTSMNGTFLDEFHKEFPDIPIGISEYGCEALDWHSSEPRQGDYSEEYQAHYHEELIRQLYTRPYLWAAHVWNMFDFAADARSEGGENGMNHKGLVTFDRKYKKDAFYAYKAWLSEEPFVHICGKRYVDRVEAVTRVTVYSNEPYVELFADGESLGKKESSDHFFYFDVPNNGETKLTAVAGKCRDESRIRKVDTFNEAYRLKEKGVILNWFDITAPEGYFSLKDTIHDIRKTADGRKVMEEAVTDLTGGGEQGRVAAESMLDMVEGYQVLRLMNMIAGRKEAEEKKKISKEWLLALNRKLNQVKKEEK